MTCDHCGEDPCVCAADPFAPNAVAIARPAAPAPPPKEIPGKPAWRIAVDVIAVVLFVGVVGAGIYNQIGSRAPEGAVSDQELQKGDCYQTNQRQTYYVVVDCDQPHSGEVYSAITITGTEEAFPGDERIRGALSAPCIVEYDAYSDQPFDSLEDLSLSASALAPNRSTWEEGDRTILCIVVSETDSKMGSIQRPD